MLCSLPGYTLRVYHCLEYSVCIRRFDRQVGSQFLNDELYKLYQLLVLSGHIFFALPYYFRKCLDIPIHSNKVVSGLLKVEGVDMFLDLKRILVVHFLVLYYEVCFRVVIGIIVFVLVGIIYHLFLFLLFCLMRGFLLVFLPPLLLMSPLLLQLSRFSL